MRHPRRVIVVAGAEREFQRLCRELEYNPNGQDVYKITPGNIERISRLGYKREDDIVIWGYVDPWVMNAGHMYEELYCRGFRP